jgi:hypothetical protein
MEAVFMIMLSYVELQIVIDAKQENDSLMRRGHFMKSTTSRDNRRRLNEIMTGEMEVFYCYGKVNVKNFWEVISHEEK